MSLTGSAFALTFIYAFLLSFLRRFVLFAYVQIIVDIFLITTLLFITGGINSIFSFLYSMSDHFRQHLPFYFRRPVCGNRSKRSVFRCSLPLQHYHIISPFHIGAFTATGYEQESLFFPIVINVAAFYIVAVLSSFLTEQARKSRQQLQKKQVDLEQLEALNEKIIQNIPSGLVNLNQFRQIITFNRAAEEITGYTFDQAYMKGIEDIFPGISTAVVSSFVKFIRACSLTAGFEMSFLRQDGRSLWLGFSGSSLKDGSNDEIGTILIFQDLTDFGTCRSI